MHVLINGEPRELPAAQTLAELINALHLAGKRLAVEINGEIVPRSRFETCSLRQDDRVEIVQAIGGG